MNDEVNREVTNKTTALVFRAAKLTGDTLAKAMKAYLDHRKQASNNKEPAHGKMKLDELVISSIPMVLWTEVQCSLS